MTIGILGGGQLARMLALAGYPLGLRFRFLDPSAEAPAGQVGELVVGEYDDPGALARFGSGLEAVTYEFENVAVEAARVVARLAPLYPPAQALEIAQDRLEEKAFFQKLGIPVPPFSRVDSREDLDGALARIGLPAVLKTRRLGYDGKGQLVLRVPADAGPAWAALGGVPLLLEAFVPFDREVSVLGVRGRSGSTAFYPIVENHHRDGVLRTSLAPAPGLTAALQALGESHATRTLEALDYVGALAMEFFEVGGELVANEMAPRVHNSGHWSIEGAETSQFENHLRAILGWPLGSTDTRGLAAMVNLVGGLPEPEAVLAVPGAHLHLYGKSHRPGRKLGHVTVTAGTQAAFDARLAALRAVVGP